MASSVVLKAIGLNTSPNQLETPDGSMIEASNVIIKRDSVVESRRGFKVFGNSFGTDIDRLKQLLLYKDVLLRHYDNKLQFQTEELGSTFSQFSGTYEEAQSGLRIKGTESNGNFYFTTSEGIMKISAATVGDLSTSAGFITRAGGVKALDTEAYLNVTLGDISGFLPADSAVAYRIVWGIKDANENLVLGAPSQRAEIYNPLSSLIAQDFNNLLLALDNAGADNEFTTAGIFNPTSAGWPSGGFVNNFTVPVSIDGASLRTQMIALGAAIDEAILYGNDTGTGAPLNISSASVTSNVVTVTFSSGAPSSYLSPGDKIYLTGFTAATTPETEEINSIHTILTAGATTITFAVTSVANQALTVGGTATVESGAFRDILATDGSQYDDLDTLVVDTPATHDQLAAIQEALERFMTQLQNEPVSTISASAQSTFIAPLAVTTSANVYLDFTIPDDVTSSHFYQIYRSSIVQATGVTVLADLTPSDELQLVYEGFPTTAELSAQRVVVLDITPDQFRGANLYTNAATGEGILQANDIPPFAKDVNRFKNYTFYANTRTKHRFSLNMLGVQALIDDYTSGITPTLTISTNSGSQTYKFITGVQEQTEITCAVSGLAAGEYFTLNSANDTRQYYFWFRIDGAGTDPQVAGRIGVVIDLYTTPTLTDLIVAQKVRDAINAQNLDFSAEIISSPDVIVTNVTEGPATNASAGTSPFTISVLTPGQGENATNNEVLLSQLPSVARAVDATARSLVTVINQSSSDVYAYYLSGSADVPGKILLEARVLGDSSTPFYLLANNSNTGASFNPDISPEQYIDAGSSITANSPTTGQVTFAVTGHGLITGDQIVLSGTANASPSLSIDGIYTVTVINANSFWVTASTSTAAVTANSIGFTYLPDANVSNNEVKPNRVYYSKLQQPEAVPIVNTIDVGAEDKEILRIFPLRDSLFVFKEDGLYRISGESAPFTLSLFDNSCVLIAPDSIGTLNNVIYGWTKKGIETITESGVSTISRAIDIDILRLASAQYTNFKPATWGVGYESDSSYIVYTTTSPSDTEATIAYRYSDLTATWTTFDKTNTCGIIGPDDKLYMGAGDVNYMEQERKDFDRTDYADREYEYDLVSGSITGNGLTIQFADVSRFEEGDVIAQTQLLTVYEFNMLLKKLDNDPGVGDNNYYNTLVAAAGDNLRAKLVALAAKLDADPGLSFSDYADRITGGGGSYSTTINSISVADPAVITTAADHYLYNANGNGRIINITGTGSNASVNGQFEVTRTGATTFSVPVEVISVSDGTGSFTRLENDFRDIRTCYNIIISRLNADAGTTYSNYSYVDTETVLEVVVQSINRITKRVTVNAALDFVAGPVTLYKHINTSFTYSPQHMGDPLGFKHLREATVMFQNKAFTAATVSFATDLLPSFIDIDFSADSNGIFGMGSFGGGFFGGASNSAPFRTYVPKTCQRCRYIVVKFTHNTAREQYAVYGITLTGEISLSSRAYK